MQSTGGRVRAAAELAAGVQLGVDDLDAGQTGARLDVDRDATTVVPDLDRAVGVQEDLDPVTVAAEGLVDRVVDDLPHAVHEAALVGRADVHARPLADGLEPLEDLQVVRGVVLRGLAARGLLGGAGCRRHEGSLPCRRSEVDVSQGSPRRRHRPGGCTSVVSQARTPVPSVTPRPCGCRSGRDRRV